MLVLSRKPGERIHVGDDITIVITKISGNRVSVGIEAPGDVRIVRGELPRFQDSSQLVQSARNEQPIKELV